MTARNTKSRIRSIKNIDKKSDDHGSLFQVAPAGSDGQTRIEVLHRNQAVSDICSHINLIHNFGDRILVVHGPQGSGRTTVLKVVENIQRQITEDAGGVVMFDNFSEIATATDRNEQYALVRERLHNLSAGKADGAKQIVLIDDFDSMIVQSPFPGGPTSAGKALDPILAASNHMVVVVMVEDRNLSLVKKHILSTKFDYYRLEPLNDSQVLDAIQSSLARNGVEDQRVHHMAARVVERSYLLQNPSLKRIKKVVYSYWVRTIREPQHLILPRTNTDPLEDREDRSLELDFYSAMALFSKFNRMEIQQGMDFKFSREEVEEALDRRLMLEEKNKTFLVNAIARKFLGINERNKPIATIMCIGPTGTGKTETAKATAAIAYGDPRRLVTIDMAEYSLPHHVNKLLGSAPGYVGYGEGSHLTRELEDKYPCAILFDEVEKADPEVLNILLNVLDEGRFQDGSGRIYDISESIVFMTSNLGSDLFARKSSLGFRSPIEGSEDEVITMDKMKQYVIRLGFRPEFVNRIDGFLVYQSLTEEMMRKIADIRLEAMIADYFSSHTVTLKDREDIIEYVVKHCNPAEGGRSINRIIKNTLIPSIIEVAMKDTDKKTIVFSRKDIKESYKL